MQNAGAFDLIPLTPPPVPQLATEDPCSIVVRSDNVFQPELFKKQIVRVPRKA